MWAVAAFSLILDDYDEIIKAAEKFINGTSNSFGVTKGKAVQVGCDVGGNPAITVGPIKIELTPGGLMPNQNLLGWGNGYKAGVAYYFDKAK